MAGSAAFLTDDPTMAISSIYFASTAWVIVLRPEKRTGVFEVLAMITITIISANLFYFVIISTFLSETYTVVFYILASVAAIAALLDLRDRLFAHIW